MNEALLFAYWLLWAASQHLLLANYLWLRLRMFAGV